MARTAAPIELDQLEQTLLQKILHARNGTGKHLQVRTQIVLAAAEQLTNSQIQKQYAIEEHRVATWRNRFYEHHEFWKLLDPELRPPMNEKLLRSWLADKTGRGCKPTITLEQKKLIIAVACELPSQSGYPNTHWTARLLAKEVIKRGIVPYIAFQTVWSFLKGRRPSTAQKRLLVEREDGRSASFRAGRQDGL
jgi:putative transposase